MGIRQERLADEIRDVIAMIFSGDQLSDPRLSGVTITAVKISGDLQLASVYFRLYDKKILEDAQKGLESCKGFLKRKLASVLDVRRVPELRFFFDESIEQGARIEELISQLKKP